MWNSTVVMENMKLSHQWLLKCYPVNPWQHWVKLTIFWAWLTHRSPSTGLLCIIPKTKRDNSNKKSKTNNSCSQLPIHTSWLGLIILIGSHVHDRCAKQCANSICRSFWVSRDSPREVTESQNPVSWGYRETSAPGWNGHILSLRFVSR